MNFLSDPVSFIRDWFLGVLTSAGLTPEWVQIIGFVVGSMVLAMGAMLFVIFLIWVERKILGRVQDRLGPNRVGPFGIFQSIADMLKIFTKEYITPTGADKIPYNLAPVLAVASVLMVWAVIPFTLTVVGADINVGILFLIAIGGIGELGFVLAGWGSNNKYALFGAFRTVAQLISYEVPMVVSALIPVMFAGTLNLQGIVADQGKIWYIVLAPAAALVFFITGIAETGRAPFDLTEAESELVAGYNIEYSGLKFGMFYVAEFLHGFTAALIFATLFLGGWQGPWAEKYPILGFVYLIIKTSLVYFTTVLARGTLPRFRIDQMMNLNWKVLTPISLTVVMLVALVDRLLVSTSDWIRIPAIIAINILVLVVSDQLIRRFRPKPPREVGDRSRPVARPENLTSPSEPGVTA